MKVEVMTMMYNEEFLAPFFFKHYAWADKVHLILDADTTDNTEAIARQYPNVEVEYFKFPDGMDDLLKVQKFNEKYRTLDCDYVILVDSDEFVFCNDPSKPVKQHMEDTGFDIYFAWLWQIYEHEDDRPVDINIPVYEQRLHGQPDMFTTKNVQYIKPIVVKAGLEVWWQPGNHSLLNKRNKALRWKDNEWTRKECERVGIGTPERFQGSHWVLVDLEETIKRRIQNRMLRQSKRNLKEGWTRQYHNVTVESIMKEYERNKRNPVVIR